MDKVKVKLTQVSRKEVQTKRGMTPRVGIKTDKYGDSWLSSFQIKGTEAWKEGDEVEIFVEEKNGYLNFTTQFPTNSAVKNHEERIKKLERAVFGAGEPTVNPDDDL